MSDPAKVLGDAASVVVLLGTVLNWLPAVASLLTIAWTVTRLYEAIQGKPFSESKFSKWCRGE